MSELEIDRPPSHAPRTLLVASLGASWAVVPEVLGLLAPEWADLYAHHPERERLRALREQYGLTAPRAIWIITTGGEAAARSRVALHKWHTRLVARLAAAAHPVRPELVVFSAEETDELASEQECRLWRELAFRVLLHAHETVGADGKVVVSLAGGRKTMSSDLQDAAHAFSAHALLHVVADDARLAASGLHQPEPVRLLGPLAAGEAGLITPLVIGRTEGEVAVRATVDGQRLCASDFPLPAAGALRSWQADGRSLQDAVAERRRDASRLLVTQALATREDGPYEPWPMLLRLDPARIDRLRSAPLVEPSSAPLADPLADPSRWPLVDLHRHLGGSLGLAGQRTVAAEVLAHSQIQHRQAAERHLRDVWPAAAAGRAAMATPEDWPAQLRTAAQALAENTGLRPGEARALITSLVLDRHSLEDLEHLLWPTTEPRLALKSRHRLGFAAYERPGELSGSALLGHPAAIEAYAQGVAQALRDEGVRYAELRGSPHKYWPHDPVGFVVAFEAALRRAGVATAGGGCAGNTWRVGFIWIIDRRQRESVGTVVGDAVTARQRLGHFVLGLDLAGDEGTHEPKALAPHFEPAWVECMRITIHAGEGECVDNIWQAAYHLHADRIGHGLTVPDNPNLAARFRDRGIALELCPSSNREVVGFADPAIPDTANCDRYPLEALMRAGLPLTINTDNPAISRTTIAKEFLTAARMCPALTPWRALALLRLAYRHAFVPAAERWQLEQAAAEQLVRLAVETRHTPA